MYYQCVRCGSTAEVTPATSIKCRCGGLWDLHGDLEPFALDTVDSSQWSQFRYRASMIGVGSDDSTWQRVSMGEGMTGLVSIDEGVLGKLEYAMPTLSFKDRGAAALITWCASVGITRVVRIQAEMPDARSQPTLHERGWSARFSCRKRHPTRKSR